jgi:hypothetical protein
VQVRVSDLLSHSAIIVARHETAQDPKRGFTATRYSNVINRDPTAPLRRRGTVSPEQANVLIFGRPMLAMAAREGATR